MKLLFGTVAMVSGVLFALSMASANPALLPKHEGYPMKNSGSPVNGQATANDPGQTNASGDKAELKAAAFDDAHANDRTPYLVLSALGMVVSVFAYCRSRTTSAQNTALLAGLTFCIWCAWMDKITFAGGLVGWVTVPSTGFKEIFWLLKLWLQWGVLLLSPALLVLMGRAASLKRVLGAGTTRSSLARQDYRWYMPATSCPRCLSVRCSTSCWRRGTRSTCRAAGCTRPSRLTPTRCTPQSASTATRGSTRCARHWRSPAKSSSCADQCPTTA